MPRWLQHARNFAGFRRRWNINTPIAQVLDGVLPVVEVDKHRNADDQDIWGMFAQSIGDGVNLRAVALVAQAREVLIHRVEAWSDEAISPAALWHIFTPLQAYNPFNVGAPAAFFSWMQGKAVAQDVGQLGNTFGMAGHGNAHQVVVVNGVPVTTFGPTRSWSTIGLGGGWVTYEPVHFWGFQDPPFRLKPFTMLCVQDINVGRLNADLNVNFWYSERTAQGDVG